MLSAESKIDVKMLSAESIFCRNLLSVESTKKKQQNPAIDVGGAVLITKT
jgi:hypothetical protein